MPDSDLNFIIHQLDRVLAEQRAMRADLGVITAIILRHDETLTALLTELRAMHRQNLDISERLRKLENAED